MHPALALDGKTLKGSRRLDAKAVHVLSAFATDLSAVIGDPTVAPDQNEITAAMVLLKSYAQKLVTALGKDCYVLASLADHQFCNTEH